MSFGEVIDAWLEAGCPSASPTPHPPRQGEVAEHGGQRPYLLDTHVRPVLGRLRVDRTKTDRIEQFFAAMARGGNATSTIDRTWGYLNRPASTACDRAIKTNPAADALLPAARPAKRRKSLSIEQAQRCWSRQSPATPTRRCG